MRNLEICETANYNAAAAAVRSREKQAGGEDAENHSKFTSTSFHVSFMGINFSTPKKNMLADVGDRVLHDPRSQPEFSLSLFYLNSGFSNYLCRNECRNELISVLPVQICFTELKVRQKFL